MTRPPARAVHRSPILSIKPMSPVRQMQLKSSVLLPALALSLLAGAAHQVTANDPPPEVVPLSNVLDPVEIHLKPSAPSAQYPGPGQDNSIHPRGTQEVRIEVDKSGIVGGSTWHLQGGVQVVTSVDNGDNTLWTIVKVFNAGEFANATVTMATVDNPDEAYNNPEVGIMLNEDDGHLISESMMLVADEVDDEYPGLNDEVGANNEDDDRSHLIQLEGSVLVSELAIADQSAELELRAQVEVEDTVHLNVIVFDVSNQTVEEVEAEIDGRVSEAFARVGIKVTADVSAASWDDTEIGSTADDFFVRYTSQGVSWVPDFVEDMISDYSVEDEPDTINVFVVKRVRAAGIPNNDTGDVGGVAFHRSIAWEYLEEEYRSSVFVVGGSPGYVRGAWILAHEIGHMTTDKVHYGVTYPDPAPEAHQIERNLMQAHPNDLLTVLASKRLYALQKGNNHKTEENEDP